MSILTLIILFCFIMWMFSSVIGWWEGVNNKYPLDSSPITHLILKTLLIVVFFPVLICVGIFFLMGIMFRN
jgi:hypothetical protein